MTFSAPYLFLAPMEGVGDRAFRKAMAHIGGFDEAVTDFIRVSTKPHIKSLAQTYQWNETAPTPLAAQIMGSDPDHMAEMAVALEEKGAPRIDLNCGCPSNTVTGRGAGSSLLKDPGHLHQVAASMVKAVKVPVTVKMRSGFEDISLFRENLLAAESSGIKFLTLHPRTKVDGYGPPARWDLIAEAKSIVKIPVVGNGDILTAQDAKRMIQQTGCDYLMVGRGAIINPFIFHEIKAEFEGKTYSPQKEKLRQFFEIYMAEVPADMQERGKISKLKQLLGFLYKATPELKEKRQLMLTSQPTCAKNFLSHSLSELLAF